MLHRLRIQSDLLKVPSVTSVLTGFLCNRGSDCLELTLGWWEVVILFILRNFPKSWTRFVLAALSLFFGSRL